MDKPMSFGDLLAHYQANRSSEALEDKLSGWAKKPGVTEQEKIDRTLRMVKAAIDETVTITDKEYVEVYAKGSFANRTNIASDSDVDLAVVHKKYFLNIYPPGTTAKDFNFHEVPYTPSAFKNEVALSMIEKFESDSVTVSDRAIKVHASTARIDADIVPHFVHRVYRLDGTFDEGVALVNKDGRNIYNWPKQDYDNGVTKNTNTGKNYKSIVRIVKNLRCAMIADGIPYAASGVSYLIACLIYNVPDYFFNDTYEVMTSDVLQYLSDQMSDLNNVAGWTEVNGMKLLFGDHQGWRSDDVRKFVEAAQGYFKGMQA